jgi:hypothetical protein
MTTTAEKKQDLKIAYDTLERYAADIVSGGALVVISEEYGKGQTDYFRVFVSYSGEQKTELSHLTWAVAKCFGYSLRDRAGRWYIAMGGGNYSKSYEIARTLESYYKLERIRYETI